MSTKRTRPRLLTPATTAFSFTFVGVSLAILFGYLPSRNLLGFENIDLGVVLLMVPVAALVFVMGIEVIRTARSGRLRAAIPARRAPLSGWRPGEREG